MRHRWVRSSLAKPSVGWHALGAVWVARSRANKTPKGKYSSESRSRPSPSKDFRSPPNPPNPLKRLLIPSKSPKDPQSRQKTSDPLKISRRLPIPSKDFRSPQNPPNPGGAIAIAIAIATTNNHEPPTPPLLPFRTSHPPYNAHATQHAIPRGQESRCSGPKSPVRDRPGSGIRFLGFAQLTTSRSRLARTRHHRRQSNATPEFFGATEFRCPGPTPSDAASPVCPSRHHKAGYGQLPPGSQRMPLSRLPFQKNRHNNFITPR